MATAEITGTTGRRPREIYDDLRRRIEAGEFAVGVPFPTEERLCAEEAVSRYALREALAMLEAEGLISRRRGAGTRVISRSPASVFRHATGSRAELLNYVEGTQVRWSEIAPIRTSGALARLLGCDEMREWQHLTGVRHDRQGEPLAIVSVYVDPGRATLANPAELADGPVYDWIEKRYGLHPTMLSQDIRARTLTQDEATQLDDVAGASVLQMIRRYFDANDTIYLISVTLNRSRDFVYNLRIQIKD